MTNRPCDTFTINSVEPRRKPADGLTTDEIPPESLHLMYENHSAARRALFSARAQMV